MSVINPTCPTGCDSNVPSVDFDYCAPEVYLGEIKRIYVASNDAAAFTDVTDAAEWATRLSETGTGADDIRELYVSADLPAPTRDVIEIDQGREIYPPAAFTLNVDIHDLSDLNYEFMRTTACNTAVKIWYATEDHIYGGNDGISNVNVILENMIERGQRTIQKITGTFTWDYKFQPQRTANPL